MLVQQLLNGIMLGSMYALLAISYTLVLGVLNKLNLAQGEILTAGALVSYTVLHLSGSYALALLAAAAVSVALSVLTELFCFRLPRGDTQVVTTIAMSLILQNVYTEIWGSESLKFPSLRPSARWTFGALSVSSLDLALLGLMAVLMLGLSVLIARTRFGRSMRALAESPRAAQVSGVNVRATTVRTFMLSGLIAGVTGVVAGISFSSFTTFVGGTIGDKAMAAMVIGGAGSALGAGAAGVLLGIVEVLSVSYLGAQYREIIVFPLLMLVLCIKPSGLFHRGRVDRS